MDPEFAEELRKKNGKASTTEKNGFSFLSLMGRPEAAPVKPAPKVSLIDGQSSEDISQVKMPVFWQAPEEPLNWLKEVLERVFLDPEEAAHPIFAVDHKQEEIRSVWILEKTKEHFVQLSKSRKKLAVKTSRRSNSTSETDGSNDVPEKKKPSSACPKPDIPIASETRKKPNSFVRKSETRTWI
uniref:Uncharacterized protein n=1 Tax=Ditylenchus dipsaci TaxID=166011 RepID=A0A915E2F2_9BILA